MTPIRPRRSALYMPGSNARAIEKAQDACRRRGDLRPRGRGGARCEGRRRASRSARPCRRAATARGKLVIRINALETPWGEDDLAAAIAAAPDAILVPKVSSRRNARGGGPAPAQARRCGAHPNLGHDRDAARDPRMRRPSRARRTTSTRGCPASSWARTISPRTPAPACCRDAPSMLPWLMTALAAARAHGIDILDGVYNSLSDDGRLSRRVRAGPRLRLRRQDADPSRTRSPPPTRSSRRLQARWRTPAPSSPPSTSRRTRARARSASTAAWSSGFMRRWRSARWRWRRRLRKAPDVIPDDALPRSMSSHLGWCGCPRGPCRMNAL